MGLAQMGEKGKPLLDFFVCMSEAMMTITTWVIYMAPVGVFFLIGGQILEMKDFSVVAGQLGLYFMTVLVGLFVHGFVVLPIIFSVCTRQLPFSTMMFFIPSKYLHTLFRLYVCYRNCKYSTGRIGYDGYGFGHSGS